MIKDNETLTLKEAEKLRLEVKNILGSDEHYHATPTTEYGEHHPTVIRLVSCGHCGSTPDYVEESNTSSVWFVRCNCGKTTNSFTRKWAAGIVWNTKNLHSYSYTEFPLFGIAKLPFQPARERMLAIRKDLELRIDLARLERIIAKHRNDRLPSYTHLEKLEAYLEWARWALRLIRHEEHKSKTKQV